jgi:sensor histidine kinase regulating citrate/malate metabolism
VTRREIIVGRLFEFLYILCGKNPYSSLSLLPEGTLPTWLDWIIYYALHLLFILLCSIIFHRKKLSLHNKQLTKLIVLFSLGITLITIPLNTYSRPLETQNESLALVIRIYSMLYALSILFLRTGILEQSRMTAELRLMEEMLHLEKKQFENIREDMEVINIKCHDIRHQLSQFEGKLTQDELESLKATIQIYDSTLKTGNEILDTILYKKQLFCTQNQIQLSCIADGSCLNFISSTHLYSLLNNAIENAIEAVMQLKNEEMRIISISVGIENALTAIHITNYYNASPSVKEQFPQTTKEDSAHHGFGIKSMRYIVQQYNGDLTFDMQDNIFYLHIYFPTE